MSATRITLFVLAALALLLGMLGCGDTQSRLVSLSVSPKSATSNGSPVLYTAELTLSDGTHPKNWPVLWLNSNPFTMTIQPLQPVAGAFTIDTSGNATCVAGFPGTYTVYAAAAADLKRGISPTNAVVGTASFTCP
jgi:hypothetical protein